MDYEEMWFDLMAMLAKTIKRLHTAKINCDQYHNALGYMLIQMGYSHPTVGIGKEHTVQETLDLYNQMLTTHQPSPELKLYVWEEVLCEYTCGVMFALAESVEQAREVILNSGWHGSTEPAELEAKPYGVYTAPVGFAIWGGA